MTTENGQMDKTKRHHKNYSYSPEGSPICAHDLKQISHSLLMKILLILNDPEFLEDVPVYSWG
jgi:hypothetical protein